MSQFCCVFPPLPQGAGTPRKNMTLHDIGFTSQEVETYMRLLLEQEGTDRARLRMLDEKRRAALDDIHFREKQLERLDYLRHELRKRTDETERPIKITGRDPL